MPQREKKQGLLYAKELQYARRKGHPEKIEALVQIIFRIYI